jgi:hypothetical protein
VDVNNCISEKQNNAREVSEPEAERILALTVV